MVMVVEATVGDLVEEDKVEEGLENPEDLPDVDEKNFRYPGPCPRTPESGLISLADAIESASRSIRKPTPQKIRSLVDDIVFNRIKDGQLDECGLTVRELKLARDTFSKTLRSMMHSRIEYPKKAGEKDAEKGEGEHGVERRSDETAGGKRGSKTKIVPVEELEKHRRKAAGDS